MKPDFWDFSTSDIETFELFCLAAHQRVMNSLPVMVDSRKKKLFDLIFSTKGAIPISHLSDSLCWSSRQINRYFNNHFGISLKTYCNIVRFRASLYHLKEGKLFPEENFSDQPHFIREVKRLAGVSPKVLAKNEHDRFIQFFALPKSWRLFGNQN
jgi:AraC-like DNA-binding protein